jgi:hypothetical protein
VALELGFVGRRRCFEEARRYVFELAYGPRDVTIVDSAVGGAGVALDCSGDLLLQLFLGLSSALSGAVLGVDLGAVRNGVVMVWRGNPLLHAVVPAEGLKRILSGVRGVSEISVGFSPYVDPSEILGVLKALCGAAPRVKLVDESKASRGRYWLRRKYPGLAEDEIDALSFVLARGIALDICRKP